MTKIAVISDIHANSWALEAVLEDIDQQKIQKIVNLGDSLYGPLDPQKTYDLLKDRSITSINGNQDRMLCEASKEDIEKNSTLEFVLDNLDQSALDWLEKMPKFSIFENTILLCHGTPYDDAEYLIEDVSPGYPSTRSEQAILDLLSNQRFKLTLCGHSHLPQAVSLENGQLIVNPGSVGLQAYEDDRPVHHKMETDSSLACYAVLEEGRLGWQVHHIRLPYDYKSAAAKARSVNRNDWAKALLSGKVD